jgi:hypothetical protein
MDREPSAPFPASPSRPVGRGVENTPPVFVRDAVVQQDVASPAGTRPGRGDLTAAGPDTAAAAPPTAAPVTATACPARTFEGANSGGTLPALQDVLAGAPGGVSRAHPCAKDRVPSARFRPTDAVVRLMRAPQIRPGQVPRPTDRQEERRRAARPVPPASEKLRFVETSLRLQKRLETCYGDTVSVNASLDKLVREWEANNYEVPPQWGPVVAGLDGAHVSRILRAVRETARAAGGGCGGASVGK